MEFNNNNLCLISCHFLWCSVILDSNKLFITYIFLDRRYQYILPKHECAASVLVPYRLNAFERIIKICKPLQVA